MGPFYIGRESVKGVYVENGSQFTKWSKHYHYSIHTNVTIYIWNFPMISLITYKSYRHYTWLKPFFHKKNKCIVSNESNWLWCLRFEMIIIIRLLQAINEHDSNGLNTFGILFNNFISSSGIVIWKVKYLSNMPDELIENLPW